VGDAPSRSQLVKIGKALAAGTETPEQLDVLDALLARCDEVQARARDDLAAALPRFPKQSSGPLDVRGRTKTLTTLREKLQRMGGQTLPVVRDLAGLRIVGDLLLHEQDELLTFACEALGVEVDQVRIIDRRAEPMRGYRALHAEFVLDGVRVELQIRTERQHAWAEIYERLGDALGREIRYPQEQTEPETSSSAAQTALAVVMIDHMERVSRSLDRIEQLAAMAGRLRSGVLRYEVDGVSIGDRLVRNAALTAELYEQARRELDALARILDRLKQRGEQP